MYGCKIYLGEPDAKMFKERPELSAVQDSLSCLYQLFEPDEVIHDGDVLTFGNTTIQFYLVPGHTEGCVAYFFDITDGKETKRAGYYGGFGFNTLLKDYLIEIGDPEYKMRKVYLASLKKVRDHHVDVFMGNHTINNKLVEKRQYMLEHPEENPFVDETAWGAYLDEKRDALLEFMKDPVNN